MLAASRNRDFHIHIAWADSGSYGGGPQWRFLPFAEEAAGGFSAVVMSRKRMEPRYRTLGALGRLGREMSFLSIFVGWNSCWSGRNAITQWQSDFLNKQTQSNLYEVRKLFGIATNPPKNNAMWRTVQPLKQILFIQFHCVFVLFWFYLWLAKGLPSTRHSRCRKSICVQHDAGAAQQLCGVWCFRRNDFFFTSCLQLGHSLSPVWMSPDVSFLKAWLGCRDAMSVQGGEWLVNDCHTTIPIRTLLNQGSEDGASWAMLLTLVRVSDTLQMLFLQ